MEEEMKRLYKDTFPFIEGAGRFWECTEDVFIGHKLVIRKGNVTDTMSVYNLPKEHHKSFLSYQEQGFDYVGVNNGHVYIIRFEKTLRMPLSSGPNNNFDPSKYWYDIIIPG